ncbi:hypothetical protein NPX13_g53 [Xylaria arbuscula]|uniref:Uncharacterized protein n=1 Tax=Xylaria arbuscula TaxID=114810 RepID=A0A9W8TSA2_9PEZI|nr:hypothetical protein NPX13_g53 [Xylaria arbuscula]
MQRQGPWGYPSFPGGYPPPPLPQHYNHDPSRQQPPPHYLSQGPQYGAPEAMPGVMSVPGGLELLFFRVQSHVQLVRAANEHEPLLVLTLPHSEKLELTANRGYANGETIATGRLHEFTTSKADMTLWGRTTRWKKEYDSFTGLGHLSWEPSGDAGFVIEGNGRLLARYRAMADASNTKAMFGSLSLSCNLGLSSSSERDGQEAEARLEIFAQGLTREQLEELVVATALERARSRKSKSDKRNAEIIGEVLGMGG